MILKRLVLHNFRIFKGENHIDFAPSGDKSVTVLLGENFSGKTTLIHAFKWCLYGISQGMGNPEDLVNRMAVLELPFNETINVEAQLLFEHGGSTYRAMRRHRFRKRDGGIIDQIDTIFKLDEASSDSSNPVEVTNPETRILEILPLSLAPFFFFEGEAAKAWVTETGGKDLRKGVEDCLDLTALGRATEHLDNLRKELRKERREIRVNEGEDFDAMIDELELRKNGILIELEVARNELGSVEQQKNEIDSTLSQIAETAPLIEQQRNAKGDLKHLDSQLETAVGELKAYIGSTGFLAIAKPVLEKTKELLQDAYDREEIPSDIKPNFVEKLLSREFCICGGSLAIGTEARKFLLDWKAKSGLAQISERLAVIDNKCSDFIQRRQRAFEGPEPEFSALRDKVALIQQERKKVDGLLKEVNGKLTGKDFKVDYITEFQRKRQELDEQLTQQKFKINDLLRELGEGDYAVSETSIAYKIDKLESRAKQQKRQTTAGNLLNKKIEILEKIHASVKNLHEEWLKLVREYLDSQSKKSFLQVGQLNRRVCVKENFELSVEVDKGNGHWGKDTLSEATTGVVGLCFITGFIELAKRLEVSSQSSKATPYFQGGHFPMVMDAPFSDWNEHFCTSVSQYLANTVPQLVVFSKTRDWPYVKSVLEGRVGKAGIIHFHGESAVSSAVEFMGTTVPYKTKDKNANPEYSTIDEVKL